MQFGELKPGDAFYTLATHVSEDTGRIELIIAIEQIVDDRLQFTFLSSTNGLLICERQGRDVIYTDSIFICHKDGA